MATLDMRIDVPLPPQEAWTHVSDLTDLGNWLLLHEAWRGEVPAELTEGTTLVGVARVKGLRNRVTWTVTKADPPHRLELSGAGKGGTKLGLRLAVEPHDDGSRVGLRMDFGGRPLFGPIGAGVARAVRGDVETSLGKFVERYSP